MAEAGGATLAMRRHLRTTDLARAAGVHPNTVRLYEAWGLLGTVPRGRNGYRLFSEFHRDQMVLAHTALRWPYPGGNQRVAELVKRAAGGDLVGALALAREYLACVQAEVAQAEAAADLVEHWAHGARAGTGAPRRLPIRSAARLLGSTTDALRNWERNGLIRVPRDAKNGYRAYGAPEIARLRVIRTLRLAGYSMMAILRMVRTLDQGLEGDLRQVLDTPELDEDPVCATDRWLSTLHGQEQRAVAVIAQLEAMICKQSSRS